MAAILLLGSAITGLLVAQAKSLRQIHEAGSHMVAAEIARELIANWRIEGVDVAAAASGRVPQDERWTWTRASEKRQVTEKTSAVEVVLTLRFDDPGYSRGDLGFEYRWLVPEGRE